MYLRIFVLTALATSVTACSQQGKKPRLPERAVVGMWRSDTITARGGTGRVYQLRMASGGMAEFTTESAGVRATVERGTWDGADSLVRVVVRGEATAARPTSLLLAIRGQSLGLVEFDTTAWGPNGLTLRR
jgi:hypothetical protein